jgi:hypothetical protein
MMFLVALAIQPIFAVFTYILIRFCLYVYEEICADIKNAKRRIRQGIWDLEWQWKLWKRGVYEWLIGS